MAYQWDSATGRFIDKEREANRQLVEPSGIDLPYGASMDDEVAAINRKEAEARIRAGEADFKEKGNQDKPFLPSSIGGWIGDTTKVVTNMLAAIPTDIIDIGAGIADLAVAGGERAATGKTDWGRVFDDSDNPLTASRRQAFETESELGHIVSNIARLVTPTTWFTKPFKILGKLPKLEKVAAFGSKIDKVFGEADHLDDTSRVVQRLQALANRSAKGSPEAVLGGRAARNSWLTLTYKDVAASIGKDPELTKAAAFMGDTKESLKALGSFGKWSPERRLTTFGQAVAWDAFMAFNVAGEGDTVADETIGDTLYGLDNPLAQFLGAGTVIRPEDSALTRKAKQGLENLIMAPVMNGVIDMIRVRRWATAYRKASPEAREAILRAMDADAQGIGESIAQLNGFSPAGLLKPGFDGLSTESLLQRVQAEREAKDGAQSWQAQYAAQRERQKIAQMGGQRLLTGGPEDVNSPVQRRLAEMEGLASPLNEDPLYQEWLASRAPAEDFMPPAAGENPALRQFTGQGPMPTASQQGGPDDLQAYKAWLEEKARMPEAELDPRVQQSLRRLEGIGELAPVPSAQPAGELAQFGIDPVQVRVLNQPEPVVTPQTKRAAVAQELAKRMPEVMVQGPDGIFRSITERVRQLAPRQRVDRIEYLKKFPLQMNQAGAFNAVDTVWYSDFVRQGIEEGWAKIDPDSFDVLFNRSAAAASDRDEAIIKQAEAVDELSAIDYFKQQFAGRVGDIEAQKKQLLGEMDQLAGEQEGARYQDWLASREPMNPGQLDPAVQDRLSQMEANTAYDEWEADAASRQAQEAVVEAGNRVDVLDQAEEQRLVDAAAQRVDSPVDDETVVRQMTGQLLDAMPQYEVTKSQAGRGWEVYAPDGEMIGSARTRAAAQKLADRQLREDRAALIARARQMEADATDEAIDTVVGEPVVNSDLMGKVQLTDAQIRAVQGLSPRLDQLLDDAWLARRGDSAFFNINDLGPQKRTFELGQGDMRSLAGAIRQGLDAGDITGPAARSLRNLADKLDTQVVLLEPQARAQRNVDGMIRDMQTFLEHGDFCDFT